MLLFWCSWFKYRLIKLDLVTGGKFCFNFSRVFATSFPGYSLYFEKVPWLRLVTCLLDFSRFQRCDFQLSFSQPNGSAQKTMAVIRLPRTNRLFLSESECHILCTLDEIYNFRDKYLTEYRVKITNILILQEAKLHGIQIYSYPDIKHLH